MPEITIREIDRTTGVIEEEDYVVFVPGNVGVNVEKDTESDEEKEALHSQYKYIGETTLFNNLTDFLNAIGRVAPTYSDENPYPVVDVETKYYDPGYLYARFLLNKGYKVYYKVPKDDVTTSSTSTTKDTLNQEIPHDFRGDTSRNDFENGYTVSTTTTQDGIYDSIKTTIKLNFLDGQFTSDAEGSTPISYSDATSTQKTSFWSSGSFVVDEVTYTHLIATKRETTTIETSTYMATTYADIKALVNDEEFYTDLDDKSLFQYRYLTTGGYVFADDSDYTSITTIIDVANKRGDCVALVDHSRDLTTRVDIKASAENATSKRAAMFSPWCSYTINNLTLAMPASMAYLEAFINGTKENPNWYATAGRLRGSISGKPIRNYGEKFANSLLVDDSGTDNGVAVNPITNVYPYGILIWGNRTLFNNTEGLVASSFLNIRQLCIDIFKSLYINAKGYMFEQNSDRLWFNFKANISKLLDNMKTGQGISGYKIFKLEPERAKVKALIRIVALEAVEKFDLTVELTDSLIEVSE